MNIRALVRDHRVAIRTVTASAALAAALVGGAAGLTAVDCGSYCEGQCDLDCRDHGGCQQYNHEPGDQPNGASCHCDWQCTDGTKGS
jgi:hypothetical protein